MRKTWKSLIMMIPQGGYVLLLVYYWLSNIDTVYLPRPMMNQMSVIEMLHWWRLIKVLSIFGKRIDYFFYWSHSLDDILVLLLFTLGLIRKEMVNLAIVELCQSFRKSINREWFKYQISNFIDNIQFAIFYDHLPVQGQFCESLTCKSCSDFHWSQWPNLFPSLRKFGANDLHICHSCPWMLFAPTQDKCQYKTHQVHFWRVDRRRMGTICWCYWYGHSWTGVQGTAVSG